MLNGNEKLNTKMISAELKPLFDKYGLKKAVLFGSVAKNSNSIDSDVDIAVDSGLKGFKFLGLIEDIRNALNKKVDVIDFSHIIKGSRVENEIGMTGVVIYG